MTKEYMVKSRRTGKIARIEAGILGVVFVDQALTAIDRLRTRQSILIGIEEKGLVEVTRER